MQAARLGDRDPRRDELLEITRPDPHRVDEPDVRQLAALAEPVDRRMGHAEVLRDLGYLEQQLATTPKDLQVGGRGRHAGPLSRLRRWRGTLPARDRLRATVRACAFRARYQMGTKTFRKAVDDCESLDCGLVSVCNESAGLVPFASPYDGPSFYTWPPCDLRDGDPILGEPYVVIGDDLLGFAWSELPTPRLKPSPFIASMNARSAGLTWWRLG